MNPKQYLTIVGAVLVLVGILGFVGIIGPTASQSLFGNMWVFTTGENVAHAVLGVVALVAAFMLDTKMQKMLTMVFAVVTIFFGLYGFIAGPGPNNAFGLANLENPLDNILHLVLGTWAAYISWFKKG